jgi:putative tricarboxylic transport membrane protein
VLAASCLVAAIIVVSSAVTAVTAADWKPERNVDIIVGVSPGGGQDKTARLVQKILFERRLVEVPVTVVNKPGGGGTIGWTTLTQRPADGHALEIGNTTLLTNHLFGRTAISYADVTPVAILLAESLAFSVREDSPIKSGRDLVERLRKDAGSLSVSIGSSLGGPNHIALALVAKAAGGDPRKLKAVVFQGGGDAVTALLGGHVDLISSAANNVIGHVTAGKVRVIGITAAQRLAGMFAAVPTWREQGVNVVISNWRLVAAPKGATQAQIAFWENALGKVVETEEWKKDLAQNDFENLFMKSQETSRYLKAQNEEFRAALTEIGAVK